MATLPTDIRSRDFDPSLWKTHTGNIGSEIAFGFKAQPSWMKLVEGALVGGALGSATLGSAAAVSDQAPPVDQGAVDTSGMGGGSPVIPDTGGQPEQLSGPVNDSSTATDAAFGGPGDTIVPSAIDQGTLDTAFPSSETGGGSFDTMSGEATGSGSFGPMEPGATDAGGGGALFSDIGAKAFKYGPLALGGISALAQKQAYNRAAAHINSIGGPQRALGNQLIAQFNAGQLNPADQAAIDKWTATATAQSRQFFANSGQSSSTAALQSERDIGAQANAMRAQALQNMLVQGTNLLGMSDRYQLAAVQAELRGDTALAGNLASFMTIFAKLYSAEA